MKHTTYSLCVLLFAGPLLAQDNDFGFLFGFSQRDASIRRDVIEGQARVSMQVNYGRQLVRGDAGAVYLELPVMAAAGLDGKIDDTVTGRVGGIVFVTPGLRFHINLTSRLSVYVAAGVGLAVSRERLGTPTAQGVITTKTTHTSPAGNYGGGLDFRFSERWSLRVEARDFRASEESRIPGRNTVVQAGFAVRF